MISKKIALEVLNKALETGGDYAEIYYENTSAYSLVFENGKVDKSNNSYLHGVGLRLLKENRQIYGYTNNLTKKGLLALADKLSKSFTGDRQLSVSELRKANYKDTNKVSTSYNDVPIDKKIELVKEGLDVIKSYNDIRIVRHIGIFSNTRNEVSVFNSKGVMFTRVQEYARLMYQVMVANDTSFEDAFNALSYQGDISLFKKEDIRKIAKETVETALQNLEAKECPSGVMDVIVGNGWGGVLFHEACGHPLEASSVARGLSCFKSDMIGEEIASPIVSAVDDSTISGAWGSIGIDDEGNKGEKRQLIKDGKLVGFMIDDFNGRRMNKGGNGACRRQSYRHIPTSRMSNTYIEAGKSTKEEIIAATKLGLYTVGFKGGSVNPSTGEFNFGCSEAYIVRDGKICEPVKGATLIGKGHEILKQIDMVGNDLDMGQGMCGASSGQIRVNVGQPTIRLRNVTVGGRGGELK